MAFTDFRDTGNHYGLSLLHLLQFPVDWISFSFYPSGFPNIKCNAVGPANRSRIEIDIIGNQEIPGTDHRSSSFFIKYRQDQNPVSIPAFLFFLQIPHILLPV